MPLVQIDVPALLAPERVRALADAVHDALVATVGVPPADRFQVIRRHQSGDLLVDPAYLGIARGPEAVIVAIAFRRGRTDEQKRALYRAIAAGAALEAELRPEDVMVVLTENGPADWSFGRGVAQYAAEAVPA
ncbi:tautomerase family protein [Prosthecomicrobium sp. N25]|uniref:tautomerase family protein n=1 Tax=Prosthecomicrobium sp. N25 TaxID=3129254 RepID=UPI00307804F0